jgi:hypothetical protein
VIVPVGSPVNDFGPDLPGALFVEEDYGLSSAPERDQDWQNYRPLPASQPLAITFPTLADE